MVQEPFKKLLVSKIVFSCVLMAEVDVQIPIAAIVVGSIVFGIPLLVGLFFGGKWIIQNAETRIRPLILLAFIIGVIIGVLFLRLVINKKYRRDPGALTILYVGSIFLIFCVVFYTFGGDFNIFDITK